MNELFNESGFDQTVAKFTIAQLYLINIELTKTLTEKEKEYRFLSSEMQELKDEFNKMLLIQD